MPAYDGVSARGRKMEGFRSIGPRKFFAPEPMGFPARRPQAAGSSSSQVSSFGFVN